MTQLRVLYYRVFFRLVLILSMPLGHEVISERNDQQAFDHTPENSLSLKHKSQCSGLVDRETSQAVLFFWCLRWWLLFHQYHQSFQAPSPRSYITFPPLYNRLTGCLKLPNDSVIAFVRWITPPLCTIGRVNHYIFEFLQCFARTITDSSQYLCRDSINLNFAFKTCDLALI